MKRALIRCCLIATVALVAGLVLGGAGLAQTTFPEGDPSATIELKKWKVGFIVGIGGGSGTLYLKGRSYPLSIGGLRIGATVGMAEVDLSGDVYNLKKPEDIEGVYNAAQAGVALIGGRQVWLLENKKGVLMRLKGKQTGIELALDVGGMKISLK